MSDYLQGHIDGENLRESYELQRKNVYTAYDMYREFLDEEETQALILGAAMASGKMELAPLFQLWMNRREAEIEDT